jgi:mono/diheme cytochrome c family protein
MRTTRFVLLTVAALTIGVACNDSTTPGPSQTQPTAAASPQTTAVADEFAAIRTVFKDNCSKCHGETGSGGRVQIEGREIKVPNLTGEHARKPTDQRLAAKITDGDDDMPAFKDKLSAEQIQELVRFIRKEFQ